MACTGKLGILGTTIISNFQRPCMMALHISLNAGFKIRTVPMFMIIATAR